MTPDPLSEKYYGISPYAFCNNSPMVFVDRDGRVIDTAIDVVSITLGVKSLVSNIKAGNVWAAVGDGAGIAIDAIAAAIPFVPGGVGAIRAGVKAADAFDDIADAAKITVSPSSFNKFTLAPTTKTVKNPYGAKGKPDHQAKVSQLKENAKAELKPGEIILSEEKNKD